MFCFRPSLCYCDDCTKTRPSTHPELDTYRSINTLPSCGTKSFIKSSKYYTEQIPSNAEMNAPSSRKCCQNRRRNGLCGEDPNRSYPYFTEENDSPYGFRRLKCEESTPCCNGLDPQPLKWFKGYFRKHAF